MHPCADALSLPARLLAYTTPSSLRAVLRYRLRASPRLTTCMGAAQASGLGTARHGVARHGTAWMHAGRVDGDAYQKVCVEQTAWRARRQAAQRHKGRHMKRMRDHGMNQGDDWPRHGHRLVGQVHRAGRGACKLKHARPSEHEHGALWPDTHGPSAWPLAPPRPAPPVRVRCLQA